MLRWSNIVAGALLLYIGVLQGADGLVFLGLALIGIPVATWQDKRTASERRTAYGQALDMEAELIEQDCESQIRCVTVEFLRRPLDDSSIAELESELWLVFIRRDVALGRLEQRAGLASPTPPCPPGS